jgi:hypothetical protein
MIGKKRITAASVNYVAMAVKAGTLQVNFNAVPWLRDAEVAELKEIMDGQRGHYPLCHAAEYAAKAIGERPAIGKRLAFFFAGLRNKARYRLSSDFEATIDREAMLCWLREHNKAAWLRLMSHLKAPEGAPA